MAVSLLADSLCKILQSTERHRGAWDLVPAKVGHQDQKSRAKETTVPKTNPPGEQLSGITQRGTCPLSQG